MKVPGRFPVSILVGLAACTWAVAGALLFEIEAGWAFFKPFTIVASVVAGALAAYDRWLWRVPWVLKVHGVPNLNGTWVGDRATMWKDPETGLPPPDTKSALVIRQTYTAISVLSFTVESASVSVAASIGPESDGGRLFVTYVFRNEPVLHRQDKSRMHYGGARLAVGSNETLAGAYWTDRDSKGTVALKCVSKTHALDFAAAIAMAQTPIAQSPTEPGVQKPAARKRRRRW